MIGLGSNPVRSPLLGVSLLLSLPPGTEMFQFPGFPVLALCVQARLTGHDSSRVSPFGNPWIYGWLAPTQGLSQLPTSFIGSRSLGIHRVPFLLAVKMLALAMEFSRILIHPVSGEDQMPSQEPPACEFVFDSRFPRYVCDSRRIAPSELHGVPNAWRGPSAWSRLWFHVAVVLVGTLGVAVPPGGGR